MLRLSLSLLFLALTQGALAADPQIENLAATAENGKVNVRFSMAHAFEKEELIEGLQSGLPTSFTYVIEMYRDRPNWFDDGIVSSRVEVISTFNSVTREYLLNYRRDRKLVRSETFGEFSALAARMTTIDERELFDIAGRKAHKLKVRVRANLRRGWKWYIIPWQFSTAWRETRLVTQEPSS